MNKFFSLEALKKFGADPSYLFREKR